LRIRREHKEIPETAGIEKVKSKITLKQRKRRKNDYKVL